MTPCQGRMKTYSLFVLESGVKFNIWDIVCAA